MYLLYMLIIEYCFRLKTVQLMVCKYGMSRCSSSLLSPLTWYRTSDNVDEMAMLLFTNLMLTSSLVILLYM